MTLFFCLSIYQIATSVVQDSSDLRILVRSKRYMLNKMPRPNNLQHANSTSAQSANLKDSSKNISLVLAGLLDDYDYNQRPGYGGKCECAKMSWINSVDSFERMMAQVCGVNKVWASPKCDTTLI